MTFVSPFSFLPLPLSALLLVFPIVNALLSSNEEMDVVRGIMEESECNHMVIITPHSGCDKQPRDARLSPGVCLTLQLRIYKEVQKHPAFEAHPTEDKYVVMSFHFYILHHCLSHIFTTLINSILFISSIASIVPFISLEFIMSFFYTFSNTSYLVYINYQKDT